tara:strand:- start:2006 stop:2830 length:825 start_codon:yes stop_codon:yes gene_type:complete
VALNKCLLISKQWSLFHIQENERRAHFLFLNIFSVNKNILVGNALRYLLKIDLLIHARNIGRKMRDERTIELLYAKILMEAQLSINKDKTLVYFHGTSVSNLTEFKLGIKGAGECVTPINGIWLSEKLEGARWSAGRASNVNKTANGYVYKVTLKPCLIVADATQSSLDESLFESYKRSQPFLKRLMLKNDCWYSRFDVEANAKLRKKYKVPDEVARNNIIEICNKIKMDGYLNPLVVLNDDGSTTGVNEPMYGKSLLLINTSKVDSIELVESV